MTQKKCSICLAVITQSTQENAWYTTETKEFKHDGARSSYSNYQCSDECLVTYLRAMPLTEREEAIDRINTLHTAYISKRSPIVVTTQECNDPEIVDGSTLFRIVPMFMMNPRAWQTPERT